ncbi:hypothetical protein AKH08_15995 [Vibrio parahaemolyticus]|nr:hypothetical protein AKH08_15995 [Vibrio parahaemolyticus]
MALQSVRVITKATIISSKSTLEVCTVTVQGALTNEEPITIALNSSHEVTYQVAINIRLMTKSLAVTILSNLVVKALVVAQAVL